MERHVTRKHPEKVPKKSELRKDGPERRFGLSRGQLVVLVLILVTGGVIAYFALAPGQFGPHGPVTQECVQHGGAATFHIHADLRITVNGSGVAVPDGIGLTPCMRPLHTHDDSGHIHIEYKHRSDFTLGEFFEVWGQPFDSSQVLQHKVGGGATLTMKVDGDPNSEFRALVLRNGQQVEILFG